jgi:tetratricopeptide (TPR) repeat protein
MARPYFVTTLSVSALALLAAIGWSQFKGPTMPDLVPAAAADTVAFPPLTEAQIVADLRARLDKVAAAMATAATPADIAALARAFDKLSRNLADPASALAQAKADRASLAEVTAAFALPAPEGTDAATAALAAGNIAEAAPAFAAIRAQAEADIRRAARAAFALGRIALAQGDDSAALGFFRRAGDLDGKYDYLKAAQTLAIQSGQTDLAMSLSNPLLQSALAEYGEISAERAEALAQVAQVFLIAQKPADAEKLLREALAVGERATGGKDAAAAQRLNNLAAVLRSAGFANAAEPLYRQAIGLDRDATPPNPESAERLANLAELLVATDRTDEADSLYLEAIAAVRAAYGPTHPDLAPRIAALADLRRALGKTDAAFPLYLEVVEVSRAALGPDHPMFRTRLDQIAGALRSIGKNAEAEALYRELIERTADSLGKDSADYGRALNNLGLLLGDTDRKPEAEALYREALAVLSKVNGAQSDDAKQVAANLGALMAKTP